MASTTKKRIYVASSWRNELQPAVVQALRRAGHEVYDFRNPKPGEHGFHWSEIDPGWREWTPEEFREGLRHPIAVSGFQSDFCGMEWADTCVMVQPCGRSAHLEAGYFVGARKRLIVLLWTGEPELMYLLTAHANLCCTLPEVLEACARD
jgi:hypothetical protein